MPQISDSEVAVSAVLFTTMNHKYVSLLKQAQGRRDISKKCLMGSSQRLQRCDASCKSPSLPTTLQVDVPPPSWAEGGYFM